jgi:hypothetical protein
MSTTLIGNEVAEGEDEGETPCTNLRFLNNGKYADYGYVLGKKRHSVRRVLDALRAALILPRSMTQMRSKRASAVSLQGTGVVVAVAVAVGVHAPLMVQSQPHLSIFPSCDSHS